MTNTHVMGGYIGRETRALWLAGGQAFDMIPFFNQKQRFLTRK